MKENNMKRMRKDKVFRKNMQKNIAKEQML